MSNNMQDYKKHQREAVKKLQRRLEKINSRKIPVAFKVGNKKMRVLLTFKQFQAINQSAKAQGLSIKEYYIQKHSNKDLNKKMMVSIEDLEKEIKIFLQEKGVTIKFLKQKAKVGSEEWALQKELIRQLKTKFYKVPLIAKITGLNYSKIYRA